MKRAKVICVLAASTILMLSLLMLAGCASKSSTASDGSSATVSLSVKAADGETWEASTSASGIVDVKGPESAGDDKVEFTITPVKDGSVDVVFASMKDGQASGSEATYTFKVKDGKISETGRSEHTSGTF